MISRRVLGVSSEQLERSLLRMLSTVTRLRCPGCAAASGLAFPLRCCGGCCAAPVGFAEERDDAWLPSWSPPARLASFSKCHSCDVAMLRPAMCRPLGVMEKTNTFPPMASRRLTSRTTAFVTWIAPLRMVPAEQKKVPSAYTFNPLNELSGGYGSDTIQSPASECRRSSSDPAAPPAAPLGPTQPANPPSPPPPSM